MCRSNQQGIGDAYEYDVNEICEFSDLLFVSKKNDTRDSRSLIFAVYSIYVEQHHCCCLLQLLLSAGPQRVDHGLTEPVAFDVAVAVSIHTSSCA